MAMDAAALRRLMLDINQSAFGVSITVTRPGLAAIATTGIWLVTPLGEEQPYGTDLSKREPRRVMAIARADVATMPRGTTVSAPELLGGTAKTWKVDGLELVDAIQWRVILALAG